MAIGYFYPSLTFAGVAAELSVGEGLARVGSGLARVSSGLGSKHIIK